jgi:hypothetical protein
MRKDEKSTDETHGGSAAVQSSLGPGERVPLLRLTVLTFFSVVLLSWPYVDFGSSSPIFPRFLVSIFPSIVKRGRMVYLLTCCLFFCKVYFKGWQLTIGGLKTV